MNDKPQYTNRLIHEKSPYLLQHAHNPVDWYPWGEEAFAAAKDQDKPIFLSIGYATCHWCHVMEEESFMDQEVADCLNNTFINIKVDREELPEVDSLYMEFAQSLIAGAAGWPLNVVLTPDLLPFFAVTYLPARKERDMIGLLDLAEHIQEIWRGPEKEDVLRQAKKVVDVFAESVQAKGDTLPREETVEEAMDFFYKAADPIYGGMKGAPKFPIPYQTNLLLQYSALNKDSRASYIAEKTLDMMQRGGIYDHLGGGFSRYSVDEKWMVPHFEKMLYDNALLLHSYVEGWRIFHSDFYQTVSEEIIDYVFRVLRDSSGAFFSAQDADTPEGEGFYYTWTYEEVQQVLAGEEMSALFCEYCGITDFGNFEGRSVLYLTERLEEFAKIRKKEIAELQIAFERMRRKLFDARQERISPLVDDKVLSSWNGLMIHSLAEAGASFQVEAYVEKAKAAASFIKQHLWKEEKLLRRWREGEALFDAGLNEYAYMIRASLTLYEVTGELAWFLWARQMTELLSKDFKEEEGGFYQTDGRNSSLIIRSCPYVDGAEPSGNAVHCENLLRLYQLTFELRYIEEAGDILMAVKKYVDAYPLAYGYHLMNLLRFYNRKAPTIVVAFNEKKELAREIHQELFTHFIPHRAVIWKPAGDEQLVRANPFLEDKEPLNGNTTLYICHDRFCEAPLTDPREIVEAIRSL